MHLKTSWTLRDQERDKLWSNQSQRLSSNSLELCRNTVCLFLASIVLSESYSFYFCLRLLILTGYINDFEIIDDKRAGKIIVDLNGRLNKCGVISPRFDLKIARFENVIPQILPSRQFGFLLLTTTQGIMDHKEARTKHLGGKILGFFYWLIIN